MSTPLAPGSRIILVDGSAILKSCYEGYKDTRTSSFNGRALDVNALYGYLYRTKKIHEIFEFEAIVHVMDPPGGSHYRYGLYPEYKGTRKDDEPLLAAQKTLLPDMLRAFGQPCLRIRGVESDDVIGTLAEQLANDGHQVMIISPDKDMLQLVSDDRISLARYVDNPGERGKTYAMYLERDVVSAMGVRAEQVADYLALVGDAADNIPGVFKCGPKTAVKWLSEFGDLATLMTRADEVGGKIGENLREALPHLPLYQKLTNVLRDVPGISMPSVPEVDDETHYRFRDLLVLDSSFPARFVVGGMHVSAGVRPPSLATAPVRSPTATSSSSVLSERPTSGRPATGGYRPTAVAREGDAQTVSGGLVAPLGDPLASVGPRDHGHDVLGELFGNADAPGEVADPFAGLGESEAETLFADSPEAQAFSDAAPLLTEEVVASAPPPRTGRPGRMLR